MKRTWLVALVAVVIGMPAVVAAQGTPAPRPRASTRVRPRGFTYNYNSENRGRIGVVVNTAANADSDKIGARIAAVTPGGPADKAGPGVGPLEIGPARALRRKGVGLVLEPADRDPRHLLAPIPMP